MSRPDTTGFTHRSRRIRHAASLAALLGAIAALLLSFNPIPVSQGLDIAAIRHREGHSYTAPLLLDRFPAGVARIVLDDGADTNDASDSSGLRLFENGREVGVAHQLHADIAQKGAGRFSHWRGGVIFSAPDNSNPSRNARAYSVRYGVAPSGWLILALVVASAAALWPELGSTLARRWRPAAIEPLAITSAFVAQIDKYRGIFAVMVLLGHALDISRLHATSDYFLGLINPSRGFLGFVWVVGFVVLSGFCIQLSIMKTRAFYPGRYALQRITRIYPLLIACVVVSGVLEAIMFGSASRPNVWQGGVNGACFGYNLAGFGGFSCQFGSIAPAYTLSYELLYYTLWGLTLSFLSARARLGILVNVALTITAVVSEQLWRPLLPLWLQGVLAPFILLIYLPWLIGAATALYLDRVAAIPVVRALSRYSWLFLFFVCIVSFEKFAMPSWEVTLSSFVFYILLSVGVSMLIINAYTRRDETRIDPGHRLLGELSYPIYLAHGPVIVFVAYVLNANGVVWPGLPHFTLMVACAIIASGLLVIAVERPIMRLRRKLPRGDAEPAAPMQPVVRIREVPAQGADARPEHERGRIPA